MKLLYRPILALVAGLLTTSSRGQAEARKFTFFPERSHIAVRTDKSGILSFVAGHKHGIVATEWKAEACYDPANPSASSVRVTVPASSLKIDTDRARQLAGLDPEDGPGEETVRDLQTKMLSENNLAAQKHPELRFQSRSVERRDNGLMLRGALTIRGRTEMVSILIDVIPAGGDQYELRGQFGVKQTSFGIEPETVAGVVSVADQVRVQFSFHGELTNITCPDGVTASQNYVAEPSSRARASRD